jgi:hypothetical protein
MSFDPNFLIAVLHAGTFKRAKLLPAQAGLLYLALRKETFTAAELPGELTEGSIHLAGLATGSLIAQGLIVCVGRVKSPNKSARGREVRELRLAPSKRSTVLTWFRANELPAQEEIQLSLI